MHGEPWTAGHVPGRAHGARVWAQKVSLRMGPLPGKECVLLFWEAEEEG